MKKAFTLLELVIVIAVVGILSLLLFRTVSDMMRANARIQQEKILAQELITLQTTLNHLAETYPYIDYSKYTTTRTDRNKTQINDNGTTKILHLTDDPDPNSTTKKTVNIFSDTCQSTNSNSSQSTQSCLSYTITTNPTRIHITNPDRTTVTNISFQLLPTKPYHYNQYEDNLNAQTISHPWFWILGTLSHTTNSTNAKTSYQLQHFINLKYKHFDQTNNQTSTTAQ